MSVIDAAMAAPGDPGRASAISGLVSRHINAHEDVPHTHDIEFGRLDAKLHRKTPTSSAACRQHSGGGPRGAIKGLTAAAGRRLSLLIRNAPPSRNLITLTYPSEYPKNGPTCKDHLKKFRQWLQRNGVGSGIWLLEFQERGAPHFHIFTEHAIDYEKVADAWYRIVGSQTKKHRKAGTRVERLHRPYAAASYACKLQKKAGQKEVPQDFQNVGRFWGSWGIKGVFKRLALTWAEGVKVFRLMRKWRDANRHPAQKIRKDRGRAGFTVYGGAQALLAILGSRVERYG